MLPSWNLQPINPNTISPSHALFMALPFSSPSLDLMALLVRLTKYHRLGSLKNRHLFLIVLKAGTFKSKVLANLAAPEGLLQVVSLGCRGRKLWSLFFL
jgi:hypothetical protein